MERHIKISATETTQLTEKVIEFFKQFDIKSNDSEEGKLAFKQNSTLFDA